MPKIESENQLLTTIKGHNSVLVLICRNLPICNPKILLPNINSSTNFEEKLVKNAPERDTVLIVHRIVLFLGTGSLLPRWRTGKPARGRYLFYNRFISILINTNDRTCELYMHFFNQIWYPFLKNHIGTDMVVYYLVHLFIF